MLERLSVVEQKLGVVPPAAGASTASRSTAAALASAIVEDDDEALPRLAAYDEHMSRALTPFTEACTALGPEMEGVGSSIRDVWLGVRNIVELGCKFKKPANLLQSIQPHLKPCQDGMSKVRSARIDRKFDWHLKAIMEMLASVSWVVTTPPPTPANFVKDSIGASDFWANKVRKEYKGKGDEGAKHVKFCDTMKGLITDLSAYLKEHQTLGLVWNPHGKDFSEAKVGEGSKPAAAAPKPVAPKAPVGGASAADILSELKKKQTGDGATAATGLKKVTRDQQTWRKEFKGGDAAPAPTPKVPASKPPSKFGAKKPLGPPKCEYQDRGCKWNVENQTKESCPNGVCSVEVTDPKQQVYIYKCQNITIQIKGKLKSVVLDSCTKCGVVFDTAISACEVVNCKSVQVQATNVCPSFSIDKTDGIVVYLSKDAISQSSFVTSKSSEMNVSWPDVSGEIKESPIPEQFVHKLVNGSVTSEVSDLYH